MASHSLICIPNAFFERKKSFFLKLLAALKKANFAVVLANRCLNHDACAIKVHFYEKAAKLCFIVDAELQFTLSSYENWVEVL